MVIRKQFRQGREINLRHAWLASLGAVAVGRREARSAAAAAVDRAGSIAGQVAGIAVDVRDVARGGALTLREQVEPKLGKLAAAVEARVTPVLVQLGLQPKAARPGRKGRKPAVKQAARRGTGRRSAKPVTRKVRVG